jgi:Putative Actinobacterial Holin-X, holin superfamily III
MKTMTAPQTSRPETGIAEAFGELSEQTAALVRRELQAARQETMQKIKAAAPAVALLAGSAALGVLTFASAYRSSLRLTEKAVGPLPAAVLATLVYGAGAGAAAAAGLARLREVEAPLPTGTAAAAGAGLREAAQHNGH